MRHIVVLDYATFSIHYALGEILSTLVFNIETAGDFSCGVEPLPQRGIDDGFALEPSFEPLWIMNFFGDNATSAAAPPTILPRFFVV
jgi:hypothetical protein